MSPNRSDFLTLECLSEEIKVYLGDEAWIPATAQGKIRLVLQPGTHHIDIVALFVPSLALRLSLLVSSLLSMKSSSLEAHATSLATIRPLQILLWCWPTRIKAFGSCHRYLPEGPLWADANGEV